MVEFIDLDAEIEGSAQKTISEIFREQGEEHFRLMEARILREFVGSTRSFVMATGGGAPCFHRGMETINEYGISIFLDCPVALLVKRVRENRDRPLLLTSTDQELTEKLETMRAARLQCYRKATISLQNPTLEEVIKSIGTRT